MRIARGYTGVALLMAVLVIPVIAFAATDCVKGAHEHASWTSSFTKSPKDWPSDADAANNTAAKNHKTPVYVKDHSFDNCSSTTPCALIWSANFCGSDATRGHVAVVFGTTSDGKRAIGDAGAGAGMCDYKTGNWSTIYGGDQKVPCTFERVNQNRAQNCKLLSNYWVIHKK